MEETAEDPAMRTVQEIPALPEQTAVEPEDLAEYTNLQEIPALQLQLQPYIQKGVTVQQEVPAEAVKQELQVYLANLDTHL
jgi:hypothetical protein